MLRTFRFLAEYARKATKSVFSFDANTDIDAIAERMKVSPQGLFAGGMLMIVSLSLYLTWGGFVKIYKGLPQIMETKETIKAEDRDLMKVVDALPEAQLPPLEENMMALSRVAGNMVGEMKIEEQQEQGKGDKNDEEKKAREATKHFGLDRFGNYRKVVISYKGDIYEQMYMMKQLQKMNNFLLIESMKGKPDALEIIARVYGGMI